MATQVQYFTAEGFVDPKLVTEDAKSLAENLVIKNDRGIVDKTRSINSAQLRRFYGEVKRLEMRWKNGSAGQDAETKKMEFLKILPMIKLLKAKTAYSRARKLVPDAFTRWIWDNVDAINSEKDFQAFLLYFEAVVGYCYGMGLSDN